MIRVQVSMNSVRFPATKPLDLFNVISPRKHGCGSSLAQAVGPNQMCWKTFRHRREAEELRDSLSGNSHPLILKDHRARVVEPPWILPAVRLQCPDRTDFLPGMMVGADLPTLELICFGLSQLHTHRTGLKESGSHPFLVEREVAPSNDPTRGLSGVRWGEILRGPKHEKPASAYCCPSCGSLACCHTALIKIPTEPRKHSRSNGNLPYWGLPNEQALADSPRGEPYLVVDQGTLLQYEHNAQPRGVV